MPGRWQECGALGIEATSGWRSFAGRFAETLDSRPPTGPLDIFFLRIPTLARAPMPGRWRARYRSHVGRAIKRGWASPYSESLGEPVLRVVGRARTQSRWASPYSLGKPVLRVVGRAVPAWHVKSARQRTPLVQWPAT